MLCKCLKNVSICVKKKKRGICIDNIMRNVLDVYLARNTKNRVNSDIIIVLVRTKYERNIAIWTRQITLKSST